MMYVNAIRIDPQDNVAVVTEDTKQGAMVYELSQNIHIKANQDIPQGHKIALNDISAGEMIIKYGMIIGRSNKEIPAGSWVHCHNVDDITSLLCQKSRLEKEG